MPVKHSDRAGLTLCDLRSRRSVRGKIRLFCTGYLGLPKALYLSAVVVMRSHPLLKTMRERFLGRGKVKMQVIGALMRKPIDPTDNDQSPID